MYSVREGRKTLTPTCRGTFFSERGKVTRAPLATEVPATAAFITGIHGEPKTIANESSLPVGPALQTMRQHLCWRAEVSPPQRDRKGGMRPHLSRASRHPPPNPRVSLFFTFSLHHLAKPGAKLVEGTPRSNP